MAKSALLKSAARKGPAGSIPAPGTSQTPRRWKRLTPTGGELLRTIVAGWAVLGHGPFRCDGLRLGAAVPFDFQLTIVAAGSKNNVVARALERFTISYDVWEEKFSVVRERDFRRSSMRLSAASAESWCLDNVVIPASALPAGQQLAARLEIRSAESKEPLAASSGINLATLIEIFSRPSRPQQDRWSVESAPFQLADLKTQ